MNRQSVSDHTGLLSASTQKTVVSQPADAMRIGALAVAAGITTDTLRYYEREGLLPKAARTGGGFRLYPPETVARLRFIRLAQATGFSLGEIRDLVQPSNERCSAVRGAIAGRLAAVDARLSELAQFRRTLVQALQRCDDVGRSRRARCPAADGLSSIREEGPESNIRARS